MIEAMLSNRLFGSKQWKEMNMSGEERGREKKKERESEGNRF